MRESLCFVGLERMGMFNSAIKGLMGTHLCACVYVSVIARNEIRDEEVWLLESHVVTIVYW